MPGWQTAFVLTQDNALDFASFVAAHEPDLVIVEPSSGRARLVRGEDWLRQHRERPPPALKPAPSGSTELLIGPPRLGHWSLSLQKRQIFRPDGRSCSLTTAEYELLLLLLRRGQEPASRTEISPPVLGRPHRPGDRAVDILIHKLRGKLGTDAIVTIRGAGYAFAALPDASQLPPVSPLKAKP